MRRGRVYGALSERDFVLPYYPGVRRKQRAFPWACTLGPIQGRQFELGHWKLVEGWLKGLPSG